MSKFEIRIVVDSNYRNPIVTTTSEDIAERLMQMNGTYRISNAYTLSGDTIYRRVVQREEICHVGEVLG